MKRFLPGLMLLCLVSGCAYYNAMYNARRLSDAAEKAEREGRTFDANSYWGQVTVKAETVIARHPDSKYAPEAYALLGLGHARLRNCAQARPALEMGLAGRLDTALANEAEFVLAGCYAALDMHKLALGAWAKVIADGDTARLPIARAGQVRALRASGQVEEAVELLERYPDLPARVRLATLAAAGHGTEVLTLADSLIAAGDSAAAWDSVITSLAAHDKAAASRLVDRARTIPSVPPATRAYWLVEDAVRLAANPAAARHRLEQARDESGVPDVAAMARLELIRLDLRNVSATPELRPFLERLEPEISDSPYSTDAEALGAVISMVLDAADSASVGAAMSDLRLFLAAEAARDGLRATRLASALFQQVPLVAPESPYAPKAMLAAAQLQGGDSLLIAEAETRYPASPYVVAASGRYSELRALEDSLGAFAAATRTATIPVRRTPARPSVQGGRPGTPTGPIR